MLRERDCFGRDGQLFAGCRAVVQIFAGRLVRPRGYRELLQTRLKQTQYSLLMG